MSSIMRGGVVVAVMLALLAPAWAQAAKEAVPGASAKAGLCIDLGAGLVADLADSGGMLVHGLAMDEASLSRARKAIEEKGLMGRATAERIGVHPLPYLQDLANLVVVEDMDALTAKGVAMDDILRVTAPGGSVCVRKAGKWERTVKPRPAEMDDWTHPMHGADGNMVSSDRAVRFPLGFRWIDGVPMNFNLWAACRGWIVSNGRCFTLSTTELENIKIKKAKQQYLAARDAWNGVPLWKLDCETTDNGEALNWQNSGPLVADDKCVYVVKKDQPVAVDAATGQILRTYAAKYKPMRLVLAQGVLLTSCWEGRDLSKLASEPQGLWAPLVAKGEGTVEAFDAATGKSKWAFPVPAQQVMASDGVAYLLVQTGNPPTERQVVAVDLQSGQEKWRVSQAKLGDTPDLQLNCCGSGFVVVANRKTKSVYALSAADGKITCQPEKPGSVWTPVVNGLLWCVVPGGIGKFDPRTGEMKGKVSAWLGDQGCTPMAIIGEAYVTQSRGCGYVELPTSATPGQGAKALDYRGARGACMEGMVAANGMFYTAQNNCGCAPGQIYGFVAVGPVGSVPAAEEFAAARTIEKGPAFGAVGASDPSADDWPAFRHDEQRSAATGAKLPGDLKALWQTPAVPPIGGPMEVAWKSRLVSPLTAPVIAGGLVFAAGNESGQVVAMDAASGRKIWSALLGGRVDTPPVIWRGLCVVGSHDGWVYAFRAKDGQLAWRVRVAPRERRIVSFGQVESVWPAIGCVLAHGDTLYANAGRTCESDGGVAMVALDASGQQQWAKPIGPGPQRMNDLLMWRDDAIVWHSIKIDPANGARDPKAQPAKTDSQGGMIDGLWTHIGKRRSGNAFVIDNLAADLLAWNGQLAVSYSQGGACSAMSRQTTSTPAATRPSAKDFAWQFALPRGYQIEAMALAGNGVAIAGRVSDSQNEKITGFAMLLSADGQKTAEIALDTPPTYDGLAVAGGRVYVAMQNGVMMCLGKE